NVNPFIRQVDQAAPRVRSSPNSDNWRGVGRVAPGSRNGSRSRLRISSVLLLGADQARNCPPWTIRLTTTSATPRNAAACRIVYNSSRPYIALPYLPPGAAPGETVITPRATPPFARR